MCQDLLPFKGCVIFYLQTDPILFIHSSCDGHLSPPSAVVIHAVVDMAVCIMAQDPASGSFAWVPTSGIAESCGNSRLNFLRNCSPIFHSSRTVLHPQSCLRVPVSPYAHLTVSSLEVRTLSPRDADNCPKLRGESAGESGVELAPGGSRLGARSRDRGSPP